MNNFHYWMQLRLVHKKGYMNSDPIWVNKSKDTFLVYNYDGMEEAVLIKQQQLILVPVPVTATRAILPTTTSAHQPASGSLAATETTDCSTRLLLQAGNHFCWSTGRFALWRSACWPRPPPCRRSPWQTLMQSRVMGPRCFSRSNGKDKRSMWSYLLLLHWNQC